MENYFKIATKLNLTFTTEKGELGIAALWQLPFVKNGILHKLDISLSEAVKNSKVEDRYFGKVSKVNNDEVRLAVVREIIEDKIALQNRESNRIKKKRHNELILDIIAEKENDALKGMSVDELKAMLEE